MYNEFTIYWVCGISSKVECCASDPVMCVQFAYTALLKKGRNTMKYNENYELYLDDDLVIYYWDKKKDKLMQRTIHKKANGYLRVTTKL